MRTLLYSNDTVTLRYGAQGGTMPIQCGTIPEFAKTDIVWTFRQAAPAFSVSGWTWEFIAENIDTDDNGNHDMFAGTVGSPDSDGAFTVTIPLATTTGKGGRRYRWELRRTNSGSVSAKAVGVLSLLDTAKE